jgi:hypothetical protein
MGGLCSKANRHIANDGHQVLGSAPGSTTSTSASNLSPEERRKAAAEAAERRQQAVCSQMNPCSNPPAHLGTGVDF